MFDMTNLISIVNSGLNCMTTSLETLRMEAACDTVVLPDQALVIKEMLPEALRVTRVVWEREDGSFTLDCSPDTTYVGTVICVYC